LGSADFGSARCTGPGPGGATGVFGLASAGAGTDAHAAAGDTSASTADTISMSRARRADMAMDMILPRSPAVVVRSCLRTTDTRQGDPRRAGRQPTFHPAGISAPGDAITE